MARELQAHVLLEELQQNWATGLGWLHLGTEAARARPNTCVEEPLLDQAISSQQLTVSDQTSKLSCLGSTSLEMTLMELIPKRLKLVKQQGIQLTAEGLIAMTLR